MCVRLFQWNNDRLTTWDIQLSRDQPPSGQWPRDNVQPLTDFPDSQSIKVNDIQVKSVHKTAANVALLLLFVCTNWCGYNRATNRLLRLWQSWSRDHNTCRTAEKIPTTMIGWPNGPIQSQQMISETGAQIHTPVLRFPSLTLCQHSDSYACQSSFTPKSVIIMWKLLSKCRDRLLFKRTFMLWKNIKRQDEWRA